MIELTSPSQRTVITGMGCVSPFGSGGVDVITTMLRQNTTAIGPITGFDTDKLSRHLGAELPDTALVQTEEGRRWSRVSQMAVTACRHAAAEAGLVDPAILQHVGLVLGSEYGDLRSTEAFDAGFLRRGQRGLSAFLFPNTVMNSMAGTVSIAMGLKGPMLTLNQAGVAGELAIARAITLLAAGRAPAVIACGVDEICPILYETLALMNVLSPRDDGVEACYPFDQRHNGPVLGEGATALILETLDHAQARGASILSEVRSASWGALPSRPHQYPSPDRLHTRRLNQTLAAATNIDIAYLSGSGDPRHDTTELALLHQAFGTQSPMLTSITHLTGEYGSLGTLRVAAAVLTATEGLLPTLDYLCQPIRSDMTFATDLDRLPETVLVHGLARGGLQTAILIAPPPQP